MNNLRIKRNITFLRETKNDENLQVGAYLLFIEKECERVVLTSL